MKNGKLGFVVIVDNKNQEDDKIHYPHCYTVTEEAFIKKVLDNNNDNGNYFYTDTIGEAETEFDARPCRKCKPDS